MPDRGVRLRGFRLPCAHHEPGRHGHFDLYDGDDLLLELAGDGSVQAKYMYYPGIDHPHSVIRGTQTAYFATNQVGSVRALFNSAGQVLNQYAYRPFGEMESASEQIANPLRFTAREYDASTGLYYYRNRWYDPQLARFISEDPIGVAGGINAYTYVENDPVNWRDPSGLLMCTWYTVSYSMFDQKGRRFSNDQFLVLSNGCAQQLGAGTVRSGPRMPGGGITMGSAPRGHPRGGDGSMPHQLIFRPGACVAANADVDVKYGAVAGAGINLGFFEAGVEFDAGSLNAGTSGFALTQGWSASLVGSVPLLGSVGGSCEAQRVLGWSGNSETSHCEAGVSRSANFQSTRSRGKIGRSATLGAGISVSLDLKNLVRCLVSFSSENRRFGV